jgi:hypothetical protein
VLKVTATDAKEWITRDDNEFDLGDSDIAELVFETANHDDDDRNESPPALEHHMDYDDAFSALEKSLAFIEQQPAVPIEDYYHIQ